MYYHTVRYSNFDNDGEARVRVVCDEHGQGHGRRVMLTADRCGQGKAVVDR